MIIYVGAVSTFFDVAKHVSDDGKTFFCDRHSGYQILPSDDDKPLDVYDAKFFSCDAISYVCDTNSEPFCGFLFI